MIMNIIVGTYINESFIYNYCRSKRCALIEYSIEVEKILKTNYRQLESNVLNINIFAIPNV